MRAACELTRPLGTDIILTICMLGDYPCFCRLLFVFCLFFKINVFEEKKLLLLNNLIAVKSDVLSGLILV